MITEIIITIIVMVGGGIIITIIITGTIIIIVIIVTITTDHSSSNEVNMTIGDMMIDVVAVIVAGIITTLIEGMSTRSPVGWEAHLPDLKFLQSLPPRV